MRVYIDMLTVQKRIDGIIDWLDKNGADCFHEQRHLTEGTIERIYWHYGYMVALRDMLRLMQGGSLETEAKPN